MKTVSKANCIESLPENVVSIHKSEEDLSDCISLEQFEDQLKTEVKKA